MSASKTYSLRMFLTYQELIEGGAARNLDAVVERFAAANRDVDLDQRITFRQWGVRATPRRGVRAIR